MLRDADALARGQAAAEARMVDHCRIERATGDEVTDPVTAVITTAYSTVYDGKCRVQQPVAQAREEDAGQALLLMVRLEVHVPMTVVGVAPDDRVTILASAHDPDLPGRVFYVRDLAHKSEATARRIGVLERTG